ncbi:hypothetical protein BDV25DRAFT_165552 [Aspergillus avenaceus]|uniref:Uncharacterized protein n=1 Tax=Aspergillus avenaceus TaxID=36643 RepID=A0A5N6TF64_ASPAV|nr:hypothetical protein BDV25DRAFT_165552 [Aspergillus avenaceus]
MIPHSPENHGTTILGAPPPQVTSAVPPYTLLASPHHTLPQPPLDRLGFLPLAEWEGENSATYSWHL